MHIVQLKLMQVHCNEPLDMDDVSRDGGNRIVSYVADAREPLDLAFTSLTTMLPLYFLVSLIIK